MTDIKLGSTTTGTTFPDVIINTVEGCATNRIAGFAQIVHNPRELKTVVDALSQAEVPSVFADAVMLRRQELQQINDAWDFPLASCVPNTCPLPWTVIESTEKSALSNNSREYNIMRTLDFIGRNILRIELPMINMLEINIAATSGTTVQNVMQNANNTYLGAWYRDLIPRIVKQVSVYPRSNSHELFNYTGYDIYIHNIIFGNERKEMNDLMGGEDRFELCYDPYRVDGSAMGLASYQGIDVFNNYPSMTGPNDGQITPGAYTSTNTIGGDYFVDMFQLDDTMSFVEFRQAYRKNVWYEAPIAQNYHSRHSIHSRRMVHYPKSIDVPLDVLPFSYSVGSAISTAALAGECGFIRVEIYQDWLTRSFYCTKISDIPPSHPIPQHKHSKTAGDGYFYVETKQGAVQARLSTADDVDWVLPSTIGHYGDPTTVPASTDAALTYQNSAFSAPDNVVGGGMTFATENVLPQAVFANANITDATNILNGGRVANATGLPTATPGNIYGAGATNGVFRAGTNGIFTSTTASSGVVSLLRDATRYSTYDAAFVVPISALSQTYHNAISAEFSMKLFQIGFQTLQSVSELLTKLPNIYICTEWADMTVDLTTQQLNSINFRINNDLYQLANVFWFIPRDVNGIESMRLYPVHKINHEMPIINTMNIKTQLDQGNMTCDWDMLNIVNPSFMGLNPLLENIGIVSFSPEIHANSYPLAYYDPNVSGQIDVTLNTASNTNAALVGANQYSVNMKNGTLRVISLGINGVVSVNLNLFRLVF